jgi:hypothetical protein
VGRVPPIVPVGGERDYSLTDSLWVEVAIGSQAGHGTGSPHRKHQHCSGSQSSVSGVQCMQSGTSGLLADRRSGWDIYSSPRRVADIVLKVDLNSDALHSDIDLTQAGQRWRPPSARGTMRGMTQAVESPTEQLADQLEKVSFYGVGHAMRDLDEDDIPDLATISRELADHPQWPLRVAIAIAVRDAVLRLDPPREQHAAASLLWLDLEAADYTDDRARKRKRLHERHPEVAALLGLPLSSYERRKKWRPLYVRVAEQLLALSAEHSRSSAEASGSDEATAIANGARLVAVAADLHYASIALLFIHRYAPELDVSSPGLKLSDANRLCVERLFVAYARFLSDTGASSPGYSGMPVKLRQDYAVVRALAVLREQIRRHLPFAERDEQVLQRFAYDPAYLTSPHLDEAREIFNGIGLPWLERSRQNYRDFAADDLLELMDNSGTFLGLLIRHSNPQPDVTVVAREKAYRSLIAHTGEQDDVALFPRGRSVRELAEKFFWNLAVVAHGGLFTWEDESEVLGRIAMQSAETL